MNNTSKKILLLLVAANTAVLGAAGTAMAEERTSRLNYTQAKLGMFQPGGDLDDAGYDSGGALGVVYGRYLAEHLVLEAGLDLLATDNTVHASNNQAGYYTQDNTLAGVGGVVTLKGEFQTGPVALFAGGGVGLYAVSLSSEVESSRLGDFDSDNSDAVFGAHVTAGATLDISERFFLGLEGRYRWTDDVDIRETVASIPMEYSGDLSGYSITFNAGFRF